MEYLAILCLAFLEALIFTGFFVPGTAAVVAAGAAVEAGGLDYRLVLAAASLGAFGGDTATYVGGRWLHRWPRLRPRLLRHAKAVAWAERFVRRWGVLAVLIARLLAPMNAFVPLLAGMGRMPWLPFSAANAAGAVAWAYVMVTVGEKALNIYESLPGRWSLAALAVLAAGCLIWKLAGWKPRRHP